jgi:hypothetical protein
VKIVSNPPNTRPALLVQGTHAKFEAHMTPDNPKDQGVSSTSVHVLVLEPVGSVKKGEGKVIWCFEGGLTMPKMILYTERIHVVRDLDANGGGVEVRTWENFKGLSAYIVRSKYGETLQQRFEDWVRDLKRYVEGQDEEK